MGKSGTKIHEIRCCRGSSDLLLNLLPKIHWIYLFRDHGIILCESCTWAERPCRLVGQRMWEDWLLSQAMHKCYSILLQLHVILQSILGNQRCDIQTGGNYDQWHLSTQGPGSHRWTRRKSLDAKGPCNVNWGILDEGSVELKLNQSLEKQRIKSIQWITHLSISNMDMEVLVYMIFFSWTFDLESWLKNIDCTETLRNEEQNDKESFGAQQLLSAEHV